ncbi:MAG: alpha/beta fold hydrolase, partial [Actinomadura rubrobrunea]|nr:alpha/beta fold hydrolase [Actinomadura rubrobrunea]
TLPAAIRAVSRDAGGQPVQLVGWSLGGVFALLAAADSTLPIASVAAVSVPAGPVSVPAPSAGLSRMLGERPNAVLANVFRIADVDKYLLRPYKIVTRIDNAEFLAQAEAVDHFLGMMPTAPGRAAHEAYATYLRENAPRGGRIEVGGRRARLADVRAPVLLIAGRGDAVAPVAAVRSIARLLTGSGLVRFVTASGGHLGVLTGPAAREDTWTHLDRWLDEGVLRHGIRAHRREAATV